MNKKIGFCAALLSATVFLGACNTMPTTTSTLEQARIDYSIAKNTPNVAAYARPEMEQATAAMDRANAASDKNESEEKVDHLAYLAKQKIAVAQEVAKRKAAEATVADSGKERDQIRLEQRSNEARQAKMDAREANMRNAQLEAELKDLRANQTVRGMVITLGDVLFGTGMSTLNAEGMQTVRKLAHFLQQHPQRTVLIEGYTDSTGSSAYNRELSERRATAVSDALQGMDIARRRISISGYGEAYPAASNNTAEGRQLNRRVEIVLSDAEGKTIQR